MNSLFIIYYQYLTQDVDIKSNPLRQDTVNADNVRVPTKPAILSSLL